MAESNSRTEDCPGLQLASSQKNPTDIMSLAIVRLLGVNIFIFCFYVFYVFYNPVLSFIALGFQCNL